MTFLNAIRTVYYDKYWFHGDGRASRSEYWYSHLSYSAIALICLSAEGITDSPVLSTGVMMVVTLPSCLGVTVRRLHDLNRSGVWIFGLIVVDFLLLFLSAGVDRFWSDVYEAAAAICDAAALVWFCRRGTAGPNRYGPDPLEREAREE